jgi:hypothetical protein
MKRWTIAAGESPRVYLINDGRDAVGEIVYTDTRRPEDARLIAAAPDLLDALSKPCAPIRGGSRGVRDSRLTNPEPWPRLSAKFAPPLIKPRG